MIVSTITDGDEPNYLDTLNDSDIVGYSHAADWGYYACVLRYKYPQCQTITLTATTFQVLQPGISAVPVQLTPVQRARQELLDALDPDFQGNIPKKVGSRYSLTKVYYPIADLNTHFCLRLDDCGRGLFF